MQKEQKINSTENIEIQLLFEGIFLKYGYDFRDYGKAHAKRRILHRLGLSDLKTISDLQSKVLHDESFFQLFLQDLSINTTEMFRDPDFFKEIREGVIPILKTYPFFKAWHAGCSTGEEVYSLAILLYEEELLSRAQLYATDFNHIALAKAKDAIYPIGNLKEYTRNYIKAGGKSSFANYYNARYDSAIIDKSLKKNIVFSDHNLVTDSVFGEMHMVMCRNTLIYFSKELQDRVIKLFYDSLIPGGFLCLGSKESLTFSVHRELFEPFNQKLKIFRKKY
ncbi:MAG: protein-glutamate O-methyltransferase CheR [Bacteroidales bacterium]|nr:protein-glutamate O-methyltransferase CheR [Bacteroidales bacterium]